MTIEALKEQARRHEQQEEWGKALEVYLRAIRQGGDEEQPDISLYNRVGDIQTRLGNLDGAVAHYEQAIDLYLEADLPNNAIAVCKKVLRNLPSRTAMFLRMGQIRAAQGFLTDARQNFLVYAERMQKAGEMEEAFRALEEFADAAPEDVEIRLALASQLESHGRSEEAVQQLRVAHAHLARSGDPEGASGVAERILALDPHADLTLPVAPPAVAASPGAQEADETGFQLESTALEGETPGAPAPEVDPLEGLDEEPATGVAGEAEPGPEALVVPSDLPPGTESWDELPPEESLVFLEDREDGSGGLAADPELEEADEPVEEEDPLPFLEADDDAAPLTPWVTGTGEGADAGIEVELDFITGGEEEEDGAEFELDPLPLLEADPEEAETSAPEPFLLDAVGDPAPEPFLLDGVSFEQDEESEVEGWEVSLESTSVESWGLSDGEEEAPAEPGWSERVRSLMGEGDWEGAEALLEEEHPRLMGDGDAGAAMEAVRLLLARNPDRVSLHQRLVEYSYRTPDRSATVPAFLGLAGALARTGEDEKATAVYRQVLSLDPGNAVALEGLAAAGGVASPAVDEGPPPAVAAPAPPPSTPAPPADQGDYIDLGSLVLEDQPERTTRWFVPAEEPSGDDEADFARMLSQFKSKVAEHLAGDDATAHYDLGTAYMEMGLLQEAIAEFQQSLRADPKNLGTFEMLGQCFLSGGQPEVAVRTLDRAMGLPFEVEDDLLGIYYYSGRAHESMGNPERAREFYEKVFSLDINFKDVTERLRALR